VTASPLAGPRNETVARIASLLLSQAIFVGSDVCVKLAAQTGVAATQTMALRGLMAVALVAVTAYATGALKELPRLANPLVLARSGLEGLIALTFLLALPHIPLGELTVILQTTPLILTALSAWILAETVGWRRWSATLIGFAGVVLVARPDASGLSPWATLALVCAVLIAVRDIVTRRIDPKIPTLAISLATTATVCTMGFAASPIEPWGQVGGIAWLYLAGSAVLVSLGNVFIIHAFRGGEVSAVAPFRYAVVIWAMLAGFLVWRELPDGLDLAGAGLIVAAGLYTLRRQRLRQN
jgi:drug/metabolite transporter (DMT)-like permease